MRSLQESILNKSNIVNQNKSAAVKAWFDSNITTENGEMDSDDTIHLYHRGPNKIIVVKIKEYEDIPKGIKFSNEEGNGGAYIIDPSNSSKGIFRDETNLDNPSPDARRLYILSNNATNGFKLKKDSLNIYSKYSYNLDLSAAPKGMSIKGKNISCIRLFDQARAQFEDELKKIISSEDYNKILTKETTEITPPVTEMNELMEKFFSFIDTDLTSVANSRLYIYVYRDECKKASYIIRHSSRFYWTIVVL